MPKNKEADQPESGKSMDTQGGRAGQGPSGASDRRYAEDGDRGPAEAAPSGAVDGRTSGRDDDDHDPPTDPQKPHRRPWASGLHHDEECLLVLLHEPPYH